MFVINMGVAQDVVIKVVLKRGDIFKNFEEDLSKIGKECD